MFLGNAPSCPALLLANRVTWETASVPQTRTALFLEARASHSSIAMTAEGNRHSYVKVKNSGFGPSRVGTVPSLLYHF